MNALQARPAGSAVQNSNRIISAAFTPDPDDAFAWWALATGRTKVVGYEFRISPEHIQQINQKCIREELDIGAISSATWPLIYQNYKILSAGASVGRGYGPALVSRDPQPTDLKNVLVAIPGGLTTGAMLLRLFYPGVYTIEMPFDKIAAAVLRGEAGAGVLIHEELLNYRAAGLHRIACLGDLWKQKTGLPIPVGLNVIHRRLGNELISKIGSAIRESMLQADRNAKEAYAWAMRYSREAEAGIGDQFIRMFANEDTLKLNDECLEALRTLYRMAYDKGLIATIPPVETV